MCRYFAAQLTVASAKAIVAFGVVKLSDGHRVRDCNESITCAIGDVHGQYGKLVALMDHCAEYCSGLPHKLIFLGDYIDRGSDSRAVVELLMNLIHRNPENVICLMGNHEAVALAAATGRLVELPEQPTMEKWLGREGGGAATLASYGIAHARNLPAKHLEWMAALPVLHDDGKRFFVHAGVRPGVPLSEQSHADLLWIREPFLSHTGPYGRLVVHGHTPTAARKPELWANRLNLDSGAGYDGPLSAAIFRCRQLPVAFITDDGRVQSHGQASVPRENVSLTRRSDDASVTSDRSNSDSSPNSRRRLMKQMFFADPKALRDSRR